MKAVRYKTKAVDNFLSEIQHMIYAANNENYQPSLKGIAMLFTTVSILNGFAFLSTLIVPIWAIFLIGVAGYLAFLDN